MVRPVENDLICKGTLHPFGVLDWLGLPLFVLEVETVPG